MKKLVLCLFFGLTGGILLAGPLGFETSEYSARRQKLMDQIDQDGLQLLDGAKEESEKSRGIDGIAESLIRIRGFQWKDFEHLIRAAKEKLEDKTTKP
ncbi:MAG: hypothetical protein NTV01_19765, partial [Bacteroidia bacterium]|nr:hypothetical protein [Bacteroidia bacterium]